MAESGLKVYTKEDAGAYLDVHPDLYSALRAAGSDGIVIPMKVWLAAGRMERSKPIVRVGVVGMHRLRTKLLSENRVFVGCDDRIADGKGIMAGDVRVWVYGLSSGLIIEECEDILVVFGSMDAHKEALEVRISAGIKRSQDGNRDESGNGSELRDSQVAGVPGDEADDLRGSGDDDVSPTSDLDGDKGGGLGGNGRVGTGVESQSGGNEGDRGSE